MVVRPQRAVAELGAARRERAGDRGVEPRRDAEAARLGSSLEHRHALDVRGLREHVDRLHAPQRISGLDDLGGVRRQRRRVAGDVDDPRRLALEQPADDLLREAGARRVDDDDVGPAGRARAAAGSRAARRRRRSARCRSRSPRRCARRRRSPPGRSRAPRPRRRGGRARARSSRSRRRGRRRARARSAPRARRRSRRGARPSRCSSAGRRCGRRGSAGRRAPRTRCSAPSTPVGPSVPPPGPSITVCRSTGGRGISRRRGDEPGLELTGAPALADDQVAQHARVRRGCRRAASSAPRAHSRTALRAALLASEASRQSSTSTIVRPAARGGESRAPAAAGALAERVLELVAVAPGLERGLDRLELEAVEAAEPCAARRRPGRASRPAGARRAAPARARRGRARRRGCSVGDPLGARAQQLDRRRLGVLALGLRQPGADAVARERAGDEDDVAVRARDAAPALGERVDLELELGALARALGGAGTALLTPLSLQRERRLTGFAPAAGPKLLRQPLLDLVEDALARLAALLLGAHLAQLGLVQVAEP